MIALDATGGRSRVDQSRITSPLEPGMADDTEAAVLGEYLTHIHKGAQKVQQMICDDMRVAMLNDDMARASALFRTLKCFMKDHPEAARNVA